MKKRETQSIKAPVLLSASFSGSDNLSWCGFWPLCILLQRIFCNKWPSADRRVSFCIVYAFHSSQSWPKKAEPRSVPESKALHPGLLGPTEWSRLPNLLFSPAASSDSTSSPAQCQLWPEELVDVGSSPPRLGETWDLLPLLSAGDFLQSFYADGGPFFILPVAGIWRQEREISPCKCVPPCTLFCPSTGRARQW